MGRMADKDEFADYKEGGLCPYCFAEDVVEDGESIEDGVNKRYKFCTKCDLRWTEIWENGVMTGLYLDDAD